jgi:hypothetical protein
MEWSRESILASAFRLIWVTCPKLHDLVGEARARVAMRLSPKLSETPGLPPTRVSSSHFIYGPDIV